MSILDRSRRPGAPETTRGWVEDPLRLAGLLLVVAGILFFMGLMTAESLYPVVYTTGGNEISDLGGTRPPAGLVYQPSAAIFNLTMMTVGLLTLAAAIAIWRGRRSPVVTLPIALLGAAVIGVGVFPGPTGAPHAVLAMLGFMSGGVTLITSTRLVPGPLRYVGWLLGTVSLTALASFLLMGNASPIFGLGVGGAERLVVFPIVLWMPALGGYLSFSAAPESAAWAAARRATGTRNGEHDT
jgi:hypothetical membrane protein